MTSSPSFAIPPQPAASLAISGSDERFPVGRIFCIGRNYAAHAVEMGHDPDREPPFFFLKPPTAISTDGAFTCPNYSQDVHHEVEMIVALRTGGSHIPVEKALDCVFGYGIGIDMTLRDLQAEAKSLSRPWDVAKGFDGAAPCSALVPASETGHPAKGRITLAINGSARQQGNLDQMIWKTPEIIATLSRFFRLLPGDLIMTGTPAGVGPVKPGDNITAAIDGVGQLQVRVTVDGKKGGPGAAFFNRAKV
jgi:fumarylpyruvate hydrolase